MRTDVSYYDACLNPLLILLVLYSFQLKEVRLHFTSNILTQVTIDIMYTLDSNLCPNTDCFSGKTGKLLAIKAGS